ncbi:glycoside hydrolase [Leeuwenhoekiella sp. ZYFB001]|uniref:glycoside hydrolase n=1 Tax=Leeuwenhoekiella sp. ZYFB001 TaxID=2719912 RepID=UPI001430DA78|nr:glycoside hydrolase [Leeuwenhoekiella sp. ZYFB001]
MKTKLLNTYKTFLVFLFFVNLFSINYAQTTTLTLDVYQKYQPIDGFGASDAWRTQFVGKNWPDNKRERIAELLFSQKVDNYGNPLGIGLSLWRFYIGAGSSEQGVNSDINNEWRRGESFLNDKGEYDWTKQQGQQWFLRSAKKAGVEKFLAFSIAPPVFWSFNSKAYSATSNGILNLKPEFYDDYAEFMIQILNHFKSEGIAFDYLSPINEPQWDWEKATQEGTPATNANITSLIKILNDKIEDNHLNTTITTPEAADLRFLYQSYGKPQRSNQIIEFFSESDTTQSTYLGGLTNVNRIVSGHSYFTTWPVSSLIQKRIELSRILNENNVGYWQSEFCILEKSDELGQGSKRDLGMPTALYVARVIHADLTLANARSWQWWTAITRADFKDGLVYLDTGDPDNLFDEELLKYDGIVHDSKLLWALGNYARFVRPGMHRVELKTNLKEPLEIQYKDLMVSAFKDDKSNKVVIVAINYKDESDKLFVVSDDISFNYAFETSKDKNLERREIVNNEITLAPRSITTLTTFSL